MRSITHRSIPAFRGPVDQLPPLLTLVHGGPTTQAIAGLFPAVQYWTSRGFAVVDVNYGGSSGFGRAYRRNWKGTGAWSTSRTSLRPPNI